MKKEHIMLYKNIVLELSKFSVDNRLKVGAILLKDKRIISTGYNGQISGQPHDSIIIDNHDVSTIHAEMNCLLFAAKIGISTNNCEIFISHFPCINCLKHLIQAGIKKIYYVNDYKNEENIYKNIIPIEKI
jgi:dCMP deaminase